MSALRCRHLDRYPAQQAKGLLGRSQAESLRYYMGRYGHRRDSSKGKARLLSR
jgi:hypothetical protein